MHLIFEKRILILLNKIDPVIANIAIKGIERYQSKLEVRTLGEFKLKLEWLDISDITFNSITTANSEGQAVSYVDPHQLEIYESLSYGEHDAVCLIFDPDGVVGPRPTNPADNQGRIFQIPQDWIGNQPGWDRSEFSAQLFFGHENSHSDFVIAGVPDKTHNQNPHTAMTPTVDPSDFFIDLLLELKPYWAKLGALMYEIYFAHRTGTKEYGFVECTPYTRIFSRATEEEDLKYNAKKFGINILKTDGSIDFSTAREVTI